MRKIDQEQQKLVKLYMMRKKELENERSSYEPMWRDIGDYIDPRSYRFQGDLVEDGTRRDEKIINITPRLAARTLASGMQSGITSPMRPWFRLGLPDPDMGEYKPFKLWLNDVERVMRTILSKSNIYDRLKSNYGTLGKYGTSVLWLDQDPNDTVRAHDMLTGTFWLSQNAAGTVDTLYRQTMLTTTQMLERFGDRVSDVVRSAYNQGNYNQRFEVCHIIEPNRLYKPGSPFSQYKQYASVWIEMAKEDINNMGVLSFKGYDQRPFMAPRWDVIGENVYGEGCGDIALGDCKQLQLLEKRKLQGIDKNTRPPMVADSSLRGQRTANVPGDTTYVNGLIATGNAGYRPAYQVNPYVNELREEIMRVEGHVNEAFFKNLFLMVTDMADQPNITATQINTMREEKLMMLGPVLERLNDELLDPLIDRVFYLALKTGQIPPPPKELSEMELRVEYISVMAQAQKAMGIGNIERFFGFVGNAAQLDPTVLDKVNLDEMIEEYADGVAIPPQLVRTSDEAGQIRQERAQQQQQMQQMQVAQVAADSAKTMSETELGGENALTRALEIAGVG